MKRQVSNFDQLAKTNQVLDNLELINTKGGYEDTFTPGDDLLSGPGAVTAYLSQVFGMPVTSSEDAAGNWMISIGSGPPIPLTFSLNEVNITTDGSVRNNSTGGVYYTGWQEWLTQGNSGGGSGGGGNVGGGGGHDGGTETPTTDSELSSNPTFKMDMFGTSTWTEDLSYLGTYNLLASIQDNKGITSNILGYIPNVGSQIISQAMTFQNMTWSQMQGDLVNSGYEGTVTIRYIVPSQIGTAIVELVDRDGNVIASGYGLF